MGNSVNCCYPDDANENELESAALLSRGATPHDKRKNAKVVIVGAGPAGIHMYSLLVKAGWKSSNITILEKSDRISGKSYTVKDKGMGPNDDYGIVHEMGTCYNHPDYKAIFKLFEEYDPDNKLKGIPTRGIFGTDLNEEQVNHSEQKHVDFTDWVMAKAEANVVPKAFHFLHDYITGGLAFVDAARRYCNVWEQIFGKQVDPERYGMPPRPKTKQALQRINCDFLQFLRNEKLEALIPFFVYAQTCQGYGVLDKIPAYYGLYWNNPQLVMAPVWTAVNDEPGVIVVSKGFQSLWREMANTHNMNIIKNAQIQSVNRYLDDAKRKTKVCYVVKKADDYRKHPDDEELELKDNNNNEEVEIECDYLFLACGVTKALNGFLSDATEEEKKILGCVKYHTFCSTIYESSTSEEDLHKTVVEMWPNIQWAANGHLGAMRNSIKCWLDHDTYDELVKKGEICKDRSVTYQFETREPNKNVKKDEEYFREKLMADLKKWGEKDVRIIFQYVWDYFAIWNVEQVNAGYPWIVKDEMQGKYKGTFYIGASVSFESVLNVVEYNNEIFDQYKF